MPFHFPLQPVLHLRKSIERQHELRLTAANQQVAQVNRILECLDRDISGTQREAVRVLESGTTGGELAFTFALESALCARRSEVRRELDRLVLLRDQEQAAFQLARRERQTLDSLRERQWRAYRVHEGRREQRMLDEMFLLRQTSTRS